MDIFITKRKREFNGERENDDSVESQILKSVTVSVPTYDVSASSVHSSTSKTKIPPKNVKADKVKYR
jgi:hypothetical protein